MDYETISTFFSLHFNPVATTFTGGMDHIGTSDEAHGLGSSIQLVRISHIEAVLATGGCVYQKFDIE